MFSRELPYRRADVDLPKRGVTVGYLIKWWEEQKDKVGSTATTAQIVELIKKTTFEDRSRFVDWMTDNGEGDSVGTPMVYVAHCWKNKFADIVYSLALCCEPNTFVWLDIFAALQHSDSEELRAEQKKDRDFERVVKACSTLVLVAAHLESVERINPQGAGRKAAKIPESDRHRCAFCRVWCLVELVTAIKHNKRVLIMVGESDPGTGEFKRCNGMLENMAELIDVREAHATFEEDRTFILNTKLPEIAGGLPAEAAAALNALARRACDGALQLMQDIVPRETLLVVTGHSDALRRIAPGGRGITLVALASAGVTGAVSELLEEQGDGGGGFRFSEAELGAALYFASQAGQVGAAEALLGGGASAEYVSPADGFSVLLGAAISLQEDMVAVILAAKADPNVQTRQPGDPSNGETPLHAAAVRQGDGCVRALLAAQADPRVVREDGDSPLHAAARGGSSEIVSMLLARNADPNAVNKEAASPLHDAAWNGHAAAAERLLAAKAAPTLMTSSGYTARMLSEHEGHAEVVAVLAAAEERARRAGEEEERREPESARAGGHVVQLDDAAVQMQDEGRERRGAGCRCNVS